MGLHFRINSKERPNEEPTEDAGDAGACFGIVCRAGTDNRVRYHFNDPKADYHPQGGGEKAVGGESDSIAAGRLAEPAEPDSRAEAAAERSRPAAATGAAGSGGGPGSSNPGAATGRAAVDDPHREHGCRG